MIAIIPMKENSERVKNKNIRDMCGKPLLYWFLKSATTAKHITGVVVNTDSKHIGALVAQYFPEVKILYRPKWLQHHMVSGNELIDWSISQLPGDHFLFAHVTSPHLKPETLDRAIKFYTENLSAYDSLLGVTRHHFRLFNAQGNPILHDPEKLQRTQDLEPIFEDNASMYIFSRESFKKSGRIGQKPYMFEVNKVEAIDIDTEDDWKIAEAVMYAKNH